jgi:hypothetical protein
MGWRAWRKLPDRDSRTVTVRQYQDIRYILEIPMSTVTCRVEVTRIEILGYLEDLRLHNSTYIV